MKLPISVIEANGDTSVYATLREAESAMEPIDVENGEYTVRDAEGRKLMIEVVLSEAPVFFGLWKFKVKATRIVDPTSG